MNMKTQRSLVLIATLGVLIVPILLDWIQSGAERFFGYAAADTFYYLVVARNIGEHGVIGFDGTYASNGFHPAWQMLTALVYALHSFDIDSIAPLVIVLIVSLLLIAGAVWLLAVALRRPDGSLSPLFVLLPVGGYALLICPAWLRLSLEELRRENSLEGSEPLYGTLWSYVNGMETPLVLIAFAVVFALWTSADLNRRAGLFGAMLALMTLGRLDHGLIALPILGLAIWRLRRSRSALGRLIGSFTLPLGIYTTLNIVYFGNAIPLSGRLKSSAPSLTWEGLDSLLQLVDSLRGGARPPIFVHWRIFQLAVPALFCLIAPLVVFTRQRHARGRKLACFDGVRGPFLMAVGIGVFFLCGYNFLFVYFFGQGHWYMPVPVLYVSLIMLHGLDRFRSLRAPRSGALLVGACIAISVLFFLRLHRHPDYHDRYARFFFSEAPRLRERFDTDSLKLVEVDDGIVSWATGFCALSGTGLGLDVEGVSALWHDRLLELAWARGFNRLTSLVYLGADDLTGTSSDIGLPEWFVRAYHLGDLQEWVLSIEWRSEDSSFVIIEFSPRGS